MPAFKLKKYPDRKNFYNTIFNDEKEITFEFYPGFPAALKVIGLATSVTDEHYSLGLQHVYALGLITSEFIQYAQYIMINQTPETKEKIIENAGTKLVTFLQSVFNHLHPNTTRVEMPEYWDFIKEALKEGISTDYNEETVKKHLERIQYYRFLERRLHPSLAQYKLIGSVSQAYKALDLNLNEKKIALHVLGGSLDRIEASCNKVTTYNVPYLPSLLSTVGTTAAWCFAVPYAPVFMGITIAASAGYAWGRPKLKEEQKNKYLAIGKEVIHQCTGQKINYNSSCSCLKDEKQQVISIGLSKTAENIAAKNRLSKKLIPLANNRNRLHAVHTFNYGNFSTTTDHTDTHTGLTNTQRNKMKPKKQLVEESSFKRVAAADEKAEREIQLPENFVGRLIKGSNNTLLILKPPTPNLVREISPEEIDEMLGPRGENEIATAFGKSGVKLTGVGFFIKGGRDDPRRVELRLAGYEKIWVDGEEQSVPVIEPWRLIKKHK